MNRGIFALATAPGRGAIAVIRASGPGVQSVLARLTSPLPVPRMASLRTLRDRDGEVLDSALVLWFPGPGSYTGEDSFELHLHGGTWVVDQVSACLLDGGLFPAEPGEFTRRAFETGRLSLDQAEAVADLVDAQSKAQARQAMGQLRGALGRRYEAWRETLIEALANLEAAVDFPDEDVPADVADRAAAPLRLLAADLAIALADAGRGQRVREGYRIAIIGAPNAGKSSLINYLADRSAAITAPTPGTTRDIIEVNLDLAGYRVIVADTAGIRVGTDPVEIEGVRRAKAWAQNADLRLWVVDGSSDTSEWQGVVSLCRPGDVCLINKTDRPPGLDAESAKRAAVAAGLEVWQASIKDGKAIELSSRLTARAMCDLDGAEFPAATRARHVARLAEAQAHIGRALANLDSPEMAAEDVRLAARSLMRISGRIGAEDVLDLVFASFCIGK